MDTRGLSIGVFKAINTMKKHKECVLYAVKYKYYNGPLEGFNNKIKLLKRVSYGYSSFSNFNLKKSHLLDIEIHSKSREVISI